MYSLPAFGSNSSITDELAYTVILYIDPLDKYRGLSPNTHTFMNINGKCIHLYKRAKAIAYQKSIRNAQLKYAEVVFEP